VILFAGEELDADVGVVQLAQGLLERVQILQERLGEVGEGVLYQLGQIADLLDGDAQAMGSCRIQRLLGGVEAFIEPIEMFPQHLADLVAAEPARQIEIPHGFLQKRDGASFPDVQPLAQRAFGPRQQGPAFGGEMGVAVREPGDLEPEVADRAERVLHRLDRPVQLAQPEEPQRGPQPAQSDPHVVHRLLRRALGEPRLVEAHIQQPRFQQQLRSLPKGRARIQTRHLGRLRHGRRSL